MFWGYYPWLLALALWANAVSWMLRGERGRTSAAGYDRSSGGRGMTDERSADLVIALALNHHLVISDNVPFDHLAQFLARVGRWLIIEFVPKEDPQLQKLLTWRKDIFAEYSEKAFEEAFQRFYTFRRTSILHDKGRKLYLMESVSSES